MSFDIRVWSASIPLDTLNTAADARVIYDSRPWNGKVLTESERVACLLVFVSTLLDHPDAPGYAAQAVLEWLSEHVQSEGDQHA